MIQLLSFDPGGTTGVAYGEYDDTTGYKLIWHNQIQGSLKGFLDFHWDQLEPLKIDQIVCESFTLREGVYGADLSPVYIIGALEALYPTTEIIYQAPLLKPLCDDTRLKAMDLYTPGRGHAMDAVRHAIIYLRNKKHLPTLRKGWQNE
jgi:hypothetical protein